MKNYYFIIVLIFSVYSRNIFAQVPIFSPISGSNLININEGFAGSDTNYRFAVNNLFEQNGVRKINSTILSFDMAIPRIWSSVGAITLFDRMGSMNQLSSFKFIYSFNLPISKNIKMNFSFNYSYNKQKTDLSALFDRYKFNMISNTGLIGVTNTQYNSFGSGILINHKNFFSGLSISNYNNPIEAKFTDKNISCYLPRKESYVVGLRFYTKFGNFTPILCYTVQSERFYFHITKDPLLNKVTSTFVMLNYEKGKFLAGIGIRNENLNRLGYTMNAGLKLKEIKLNYCFGIIPYQNLGYNWKAAVFNQITMEIGLNQKKENNSREEHDLINYISETDTIYYNGGEIHFIIEKLNGVYDGEFVEYFENEIIYKKCIYRMGKLNWYYKEYFKSGEIQIDGNYSNDLKQGKWKYFDQNGKLLKIEVWKKGNLESEEINK